jgi:hypothetical protein
MQYDTATATDQSSKEMDTGTVVPDPEAFLDARDGDDYEADEEDDYMLELEDDTGTTKTEAERRAERRKMKRFR